MSATADFMIRNRALQRYILANEKIIIATHRHWAMLWEPILTTAGAFVLAVFVRPWSNASLRSGRGSSLAVRVEPPDCAHDIHPSVPPMHRAITLADLAFPRADFFVVVQETAASPSAPRHRAGRDEFRVPGLLLGSPPPTTRRTPPERNTLAHRQAVTFIERWEHRQRQFMYSHLSL